MRLIDADAFNDWILSHFAEPQNALILTLQGFIAEQPTAYDIDKVVDELDEYITKIVGRKSALYQTIMQIVKGGGKDEIS